MSIVPFILKMEHHFRAQTGSNKPILAIKVDEATWYKMLAELTRMLPAHTKIPVEGNPASFHVYGIEVTK